jgi:peptidyl-prolyl cis-trans isomerase C
MCTAFGQNGGQAPAPEKKQDSKKEQSGKENQQNTNPSQTPTPIEDPNVKRADLPPPPPPTDNNRLLTLDPKTVIGEVNGQPVRLEDINRIIDFGNPDIKAQPWNDVTKKDLLQKYLEYQSFYYEALANKVDENPDIRGRLELFRQQLYANHYLSQEAKKIKPTEAELKKYYEEHRKEFETPENLNASHILVKTEAEARDIKKQLDAGADFATLAKQYSLDTTNKDRGGELGFFMRGAMLPAFDEAAFKLKPGVISDPVQTSFGWHVIKVTEVRPRSVQSFDESKKNLESRLTAQMQQDWFNKKREELKNKYGVKVYEQYFTPPGNPQSAPANAPVPALQDKKPGTPALTKPVPPDGN